MSAFTSLASNRALAASVAAGASLWLRCCLKEGDLPTNLGAQPVSTAHRIHIPSPAASNDGSDLQFCSTCAFSEACLSEGYGKPELEQLHVLVTHTGPLAEGETIFREGEEFNAIAAIRAGTVKTYVVDEDGNEQVLGFYLPGEMIGLSGIHGGVYPCNAVALDTVMLCRFSFPRLATLAAKLPGVQQQLFRLLSADIGKAALLAGDHRADQRLAAFLVQLSRRYAARGFSPTRFMLTMSRTDIANYLRLAPETVSRVLRRFQDDGLLKVERREVALDDLDALEALARPILRE